MEEEIEENINENVEMVKCGGTADAVDILDGTSRSIFAIADFHLSFPKEGGGPGTKPMNIFGGNWDNYEERIREDWNAKVGDDDIGVIAGDLSWAMKMEDAAADFAYLKSLRGTKIVIRGNHDYWWKSISRIREELGADFHVLQNDSVRIAEKGIVFAGTRGWKVPERFKPQKDDDRKIYEREVVRMDLALKDAKSKMVTGNDGRKDKLVAIIHYPPFNATRDDSGFTKLFEEHGVDAVIYGHLHGKPGKSDIIVTKNGIKYYLTSCDMLNHTVLKIEL